MANKNEKKTRGKQYACSNCEQKGHNKRTCPEPAVSWRSRDSKRTCPEPAVS